MTHAEVTRLLENTRAADAALEAACPVQVEVVAGKDVRWCKVVPGGWNHQERAAGLPPRTTIGYDLAVRDADGSRAYASSVHDLPLPMLARIIELRTALDAWQRNEGPWPLARP